MTCQRASPHLPGNNNPSNVWVPETSSTSRHLLIFVEEAADVVVSLDLADVPLDDRTWQDIVDQARSLIPRFTPEWTDHNPSDPSVASAFTCPVPHDTFAGSVMSA
jgi:hypothetical protein